MLKLVIKICILGALLISSVSSAQIERCAKPDKTFVVFYEHFVSNVSFQKSRIIYPLVYRFGDYAMTNPIVELWDQEKVESLPDPLIRNKKQRKAEKVEQTFLLITNRYSEVFHDVPNADYERVLYKFRNVDRCWYLEEVHDRSE